MKNLRRFSGLCGAGVFATVLAIGTGVPDAGLLRAQTPATGIEAEAPDAPQPPEAADVPAPPAAPDAVRDPFDSGPVYSGWTRPVVRVGQDYVLRQGERVREMVVVFGSARIAGEVERDVVVVLGNAYLEPTARIHGSLVVTAGGAVIENGATVGRELVVTGGGIDAPEGFSAGREQVVIGIPGMSGRIDAVTPWFTRGLLWGRLIVPGLAWMWVVVGVVVFLYLVLALLFDKPVRQSQQMVTERPLGSFLMGLLVLLLIGPAAFILVVSVVGIPVVPFLLLGMFVAGLFGKLGLTRWIGNRIVAETESDNRAQALRSFAIGTAIILCLYMVPVVGVMVWALGGLVGLGAATLAFSSAWKRENPGRPRPPRQRATDPVVPPFAGPTAGGASAMAADGGANPSLSMDPDAVNSEFVSEAQTYSAPDVPPVVPPPHPVGASDLLAQPRAPFLDRLAAFALDVLLVGIAFNFLYLDGGRAFFTILLAYHVIFWSLKATTVGGIICNLRVVRTDGSALTFADALIRGFSSIFSIAALGIGCLWILFDAESQAWHDRFAGTYVVKVPRNWPV